MIIEGRHKGFHTHFVWEIDVYPDGSEVYKYYDNVEIKFEPLEGLKVKGRLLSATEYKGQLIFTFEDEIGELQQLNLDDDKVMVADAIDEITKLENDASVQVRYAVDGKAANEASDRLELLHLERRSIDARSIVCDQLFRIHCAKKSFAELFTTGSTSSRKHQSKPSSKQKEISLATATERVAKKHKRRHFKVERIELCRELLSQYCIRGRPGYTPEELNNNVAQLNAKTGKGKFREPK